MAGDAWRLLDRPAKAARNRGKKSIESDRATRKSGVFAALRYTQMDDLPTLAATIGAGGKLRMSQSASEANTHLTRLTSGDRSAVKDLMPLVYEELRRLAASHLAHERSNHTLQPTALAHEAYLKLVDQTRAQWKDRAHFLAVAAEAIRRILIDHARLHRAAKRGSGRKVTLSFASDVPDRGTHVDLVDLEDALGRLAALNERQAKVVELRFFAGLDVQETAEVLNVSPRTVKGDWRFARAWLQRELGRGGS
jgi:RNA polymerase sigma factor (TIGR02999 family)